MSAKIIVVLFTVTILLAQVAEACAGVTSY